MLGTCSWVFFVHIILPTSTFHSYIILMHSVSLPRPNLDSHTARNCFKIVPNLKDSRFYFETSIFTLSQWLGTYVGIRKYLASKVQFGAFFVGASISTAQNVYES
ncbi:hypothetical protein B0T13DRAFT_40540 [Neurospora crassa]|nr:hypothetical protein B0T13DRAFT_40540 [Neurospora crassa]